MLVSTTTPAPGQTTGNFLRLNYLSLFLTTLYQQDIESGQEHVILFVVAGVVTGTGIGLENELVSKYLFPKYRPGANWLI